MIVAIIQTIELGFNLKLEANTKVGIVMISLFLTIFFEATKMNFRNRKIEATSDEDFIQYEKEYLDKEKMKMSLSQEEAIKQLKDDLMHVENKDYFEDLFENKNQKKT